MISKEELIKLQAEVIDISYAAGEKILEIYQTDFDIRDKEDRTPVTAADMAAHHLIVEKLTELTPDVPILSEESADIAFEEREKWQMYWLVDPLDGTREFIKRNGEFTVNIALIEEHKSVLGVIYAPVLGATYAAVSGGGAFKKIDGEESHAIHVRSLTDHEIDVAGSRSHSDSKLTNYLDKLGQHNLISMGSSLKSCLVAEGRVDLYPRIGKTSEWDTAAAQCIVEEAGGLLTTTDMKPLLYNTKESLLNPYFFVFGDKSHNWSQYL